jgi:hypothetical protein
VLFPPDMAHLLATRRPQAPATARRHRDLLRGPRFPRRTRLRGLAMRLLTRRHRPRRAANAPGAGRVGERGIAG